MDQKSIHVVFSKHIDVLENLLNRYGAVSGWTSSMEDACLWAREGGQPDPEIILINGTDFYREFKPKKGVDADGVFLDLVGQVQSHRGGSRIILLLPEAKRRESRLAYGLICEGIYDYWFLDSLDSETVETILTETRDIEALDRYLEQLEPADIYMPPDISGAPDADDPPDFLYEAAPGIQSGMIMEKPAGLLAEEMSRPEIKSAVVAFWSEDDSMLSYGSGILLALFLAQKGFKVALLEGISATPRLAGALGLRHPFFNTGHALSMFARGQDKPFQACIFNADIYKKDSNAFDDHAFLAKYPQSLYFLPDERRQDNVDMETMRVNWDRFLMEMTKWCLFDRGFHFLIYLCHGESVFNKVLLEMAHVKMIGIQPWPTSVAMGLEMQRQWPGQCMILWGTQSDAFQKEAKIFPHESLVVKPDRFEQDAMSLFYFKKTVHAFDTETQIYLEQLSKRITTHGFTFKERSARNLIQKLKEGFGRDG
ncbi:MAG: hypothetical protein LBL26_09610 [Peptococcaceae bacterium]|nr:hypothetical protein [Peptococcaceae bacterium]